jgi:hypothetical protein
MALWFLGKGRKCREIDNHQTLNQRVHGSSPCAPTIEINDLGVELNIKRNQKPLPDNVQDNIRLISLRVGRRHRYPAKDGQKRPLAPTAPH